MTPFPAIPRRAAQQMELPLTLEPPASPCPALAAPPMKVLMADTASEWRAVRPYALSEAPQDDQGGRAATAAFGEFMRHFLTTENVVVLAGLGTSLGVVDASGHRLGPTMPELWNAVRAADEALFDRIVTRVRFQLGTGDGNV